MNDKTIRDFIYVDKDRLNSLYSQVFEGVIEAVAESYSTEMKNDENTKRVSKGQSIETQVAEASTKTENKILYDHMYNLLEAKLSDIIFNVNNSDEVLLSELKTKSIIKVTGKTSIQDYNRLKLYMDKFNDLGKIIAYLNYSSLDKSSQKTTNVNDFAKKLGLVQDKTLLSNIKTLTEFFNEGGYDVMIYPNRSPGILYRGIINKDYLRISPDMLRTLYGDEPHMNWTMVGQITYIPEQNTDNFENENESEETELSISDSYQNMFKSYRAVEKVFFEGKEKIRVHIAPIAIYTETSHE